MARFMSFVKPRNAAGKKLFIHAGTHKTGTSFFQHAAYLNTENLQDAGILYPSTGLGIKTNHNRYAHRVLGIDIAAGKKNRFPEIIEDLNEDVALKTALISYEGFSHPQTIKKLAASKAMFNAVDPHVILVFRPHIDLMISLYREMCQHVSFQGSLHDLMRPKTARAKHWGQCLHYTETLKAWQKIVPKKNIHVFSYRELRKDILGTLMSVVGYNGTMILPENPTTNRTLSAPFAGLMRLINRQDLNTKLRHKLAEEVALVDTKFPDFAHYCEISHTKAIELEAAFAKDRKALTRYGLDPVTDLTIDGNWRWGDITNMAAAVQDAHDALVDHMRGIDDKALLEVVQTASKQINQS